MALLFFPSIVIVVKEKKNHKSCSNAPKIRKPTLMRELNEKFSHFFYFNIWLNAWFLFWWKNYSSSLFTIVTISHCIVIIMTFYVDPWSIVNVSDVVARATTTNINNIMMARMDVHWHFYITKYEWISAVNW